MKSLPWAPGKWTSEQAARAAHPKAAGDAFEIFIFGCSKGAEGFTRDEVLARKELLFGSTKLDSTITARINGLFNSGCFLLHPQPNLTRVTRAGNDAEVLIVSPTCTFQDYLDYEPVKGKDARLEKAEQRAEKAEQKAAAYKVLCERAAAHYGKLNCPKAAESLRQLVKEIEGS